MHDPLAALDGPDLPPPSPWESLAVQARALADLAEALAVRSPAELAPDQDGADPLAELDERAKALRTASAACRRASWQSLVDVGWSASEVGRVWGRSPQHVSQTIRGEYRPR